jgi:Spy/CpxP family protein refolding chaperone
MCRTVRRKPKLVEDTMKHISSAIVAGLLVFGSAAVASAQAPAQAPQAHAQRAGKDGKHAGPGRGRDGALLRGIQLTDAEKANLKNVNAKYAPQLKALREQYKTQGQTKIAKGDTAAMRQRREANAPQREAMKKIMLAQRADLRGALSPANQAKFDANSKQMEDRFAKRAEKGKGRRAGAQ